MFYEGQSKSYQTVNHDQNLVNILSFKKERHASGLIVI